MAREHRIPRSGYSSQVPSPGAVPPARIDWKAYGVAVGLVVVATSVSALERAVFALPDIVMLHLVAIMIVASRFGRGPALLSALLSVASYDFFFIPPFHTFDVSDVRHTLTFVMMFVTGLVISGLTFRIRRQEQEARVQALRVRTEELRSSLLSAVSHDLRTPLAVITGASTTLLDSSTSLAEGQKRDLLQTISEEAERLERLVANLLDMTRVESGSLQVKREWMPLEEIVVSVLSRLESKLRDRPVRTDLPAELPLLSVDPILFEQVFINLFENVSKYTPKGTPVDVRARVNDERIVIEIMDHGPGIPAGEEERVFEKFVRGPNAGTGGVGLGLAICRGIVEAHGGRLSAENRSEGGATFRIELPIVGTAPPFPAEKDSEVAA